MSPVAVVTGAGRGIGRAAAIALRDKGYSVVALDVDESAEEVAALVNGRAARCDVSDPAAVTDFASSLESVHLLVNNAGVVEFGPLDSVTPERFHRVVGVNLLGTLLMTQACAKFLEQSGGSVVNVSSVLARHPLAGAGIYPATKAALIALTRQAALEYAARGVRVNAVAPGLVRTPGMRGAYGDTEEEERRRGAFLPLGRLGEPEDVAGVIAFLASDDARYLTGQVISPDGGLDVATLRLLHRAFS
ncbi:SDR family NAD(P)-dependent oxidoreductase [Actinosynnema sp. NPDC020468]|uniref:SDR family NAD(P)-dependent oxidoreductase n=1 Tax=Actinosynnema sp. NPDC020468 TaxID=3154488 RepID=UPI0033F91B23